MDLATVEVEWLDEVLHGRALFSRAQARARRDDVDESVECMLRVFESACECVSICECESMGFLEKKGERKIETRGTRS